MGSLLENRYLTSGLNASDRQTDRQTSLEKIWRKNITVTVKHKGEFAERWVHTVYLMNRKKPVYFEQREGKGSFGMRSVRQTLFRFCSKDKELVKRWVIQCYLDVYNLYYLSQLILPTGSEEKLYGGSKIHLAKAERSLKCGSSNSQIQHCSLGA